MSKRTVFNAMDVAGFSPPGSEDDYVSRLLVDKESVGSSALVVNLFTLRPGRRTERGSHPAPFDELYYVLRGEGRVWLGESTTGERISPNSVVFIASGTMHWLECTSSRDLDVLTVMPQQPAPGVNSIYDARLEAWGTTFRLEPGAAPGRDSSGR